MQKALPFVVVGIAVVLAIGAYLKKPYSATYQSENSTKDAGELIIEDQTVGDGAELTAGKTATLHYTGTLTDGTVFDSSREGGEPVDFAIGVGQLIKGFDEGLVGMKVGGKRKLTIPPLLGYGSEVAGPIPANSTLIFEIELLDVK